jgi:hypothetical protein
VKHTALLLPGCRLCLKCDGTCAETRFRLWAKRTSQFKSAGASVQSTAGSRGVHISISNAGYPMFRCSVKSTGYPLRSPVSLSLTLPCVTVCQHISIGLYFHHIPYRPLLPSIQDYLQISISLSFMIFLYTTQSSAKSLIVNSKSLLTSFTYTRNRIGPNMLPCSTPDITLTSWDNCPPTLFERPKRNYLTYTNTSCQLTSSLYRRKWLCGFGRSISLSESSRRGATEYLPCSIMRECDDRLDVGTTLPCQMTYKCRRTLWMLTLPAPVRLIEFHNRLSSAGDGTWYIQHVFKQIAVF